MCVVMKVSVRQYDILCNGCYISSASHCTPHLILVIIYLYNIPNILLLFWEIFVYVIQAYETPLMLLVYQLFVSIYQLSQTPLLGMARIHLPIMESVHFPLLVEILGLDFFCVSTALFPHHPVVGVASPFFLNVRWQEV